MIRKSHMLITYIAIIVLCFTLADSASARGRSNQRGKIFQVPKPLDETFDMILIFLKKKGHTFEPATRKDIGQIITTFSSFQRGKLIADSAIKVEIILIKVSGKETTIEVVARDWVRGKGKQWLKEGANSSKTSVLAREIKTLLGVAGKLPESNLSSSEADSSEIDVYIKMLKSDDLSQKKDAAVKIVNLRLSDQKLFDVVNEELLAGYLLEESDVDTMAWLCKALASSGMAKYKTTLEEIVNKAKSRKLRKYAQQSLDMLY